MFEFSHFNFWNFTQQLWMILPVRVCLHVCVCEGVRAQVKINKNCGNVAWGLGLQISFVLMKLQICKTFIHVSL